MRIKIKTIGKCNYKHLSYLKGTFQHIYSCKDYIMAEIKNITVHKLIETHTINFNIKSIAKLLRDKLVENHFIFEDNNEEKWRFTLPFTNKVPLPLEAELGMTIEFLLAGSNKLELINTVEEQKSLIGIETGWFTDRDVECKITLNDEVAQEKFEPIMLEHIVSTSENAYDYDNIVVCQEDTAIAFDIQVKGHNGFGFSIKPDKGDYICEDLYRLSTDVMKKDCHAVISRYEKEKKNIVVVSADTLNIPGKGALKYQRVTVKVWKVKSFEKNGTTYYDEYRNGMYVRLDQLISGDGHQPQNQLISLPTSSVRPAVLNARGASKQEFGSAEMVDEDRAHLLGQLFIHFFVFKTEEDAHKIFSTRKLPKYN